MELRFLTQWKNLFFLRSSLKAGAVLVLFALSILVVACGSGPGSLANPGDPVVTATINLNGSNSSPTPTLPDYWCGAWATQSSPPFGTSIVGVYAKYVHNVKTNPNDVGNPEGVEGASAIATVIWPDGTQAQVSGTTGADGLASFPISTANRGDTVNKLTFVTVQFTKDGVPPCTVDQTRAAFFTLTIGTQGSVVPTTQPPGGGYTPGPGPIPTATLGPGPLPTATTIMPRPKPTKTPKGP
ncbi:MAG: hypothetical protein NVSMB49_12240 [Ktedonobacteraceae bacterium]